MVALINQVTLDDNVGHFTPTLVNELVDQEAEMSFLIGGIKSKSPTIMLASDEIRFNDFSYHHYGLLLFSTLGALCLKSNDSNASRHMSLVALKALVSLVLQQISVVTSSIVWSFN